jgi:hypothetical protein
VAHEDEVGHLYWEQGNRMLKAVLVSAADPPVADDAAPRSVLQRLGSAGPSDEHDLGDQRARHGDPD